MSDYIRHEGKTPWWMAIVIVLLMAPALIIPFTGDTAPTESVGKWLLWFYPVYVIATGICAWITYSDRRYLCWILLVLLVMSHVAMYILLNNPVEV